MLHARCELPPTKTGSQAHKLTYLTCPAHAGCRRRCCYLAAQVASGSKEPVSILHRKAEDTQLPAGSFDVVSMCLVAHELPQHATKAILQEAYR